MYLTLSSSPEMIFLSKPPTQNRLNAAVVEIVGLNVMGPVCIPGTWDLNCTLEYTERKLKQQLISFIDLEQGTYFVANNRRIYFTPSGVWIYPPETLRQRKAEHADDYGPRVLES
jgi:hypothetical protein